LEPAVTVRRGQPGGVLVCQGPYLDYLVTGVETVTAFAVFRHDHGVPVLPGAQRGGRHTEHLRYRADAVHRPASRWFIARAAVRMRRWDPGHLLLSCQAEVYALAYPILKIGRAHV